MLDLNLLLVLEAMLQHENVTAAARAVGLSQSALSNALGRLRRHYGDPLFVKTRDGMLPTPRAREVAQPVRQALALVRASTTPQAPFDLQASRRLFRFHMTDVGELVFLPGMMERVRSLDASVRIETSQLPESEVVERLVTGDIDFAAGYLPDLPPAIVRVPLFRERYVCMTSRDNPIAADGKLKLREFLDAKHVFIEALGSGHRIIERTLERHRAGMEPALRVPHFMVIPMIVATTDLVVTMPSRVASVFEGLIPVRTLELPLAIPRVDVSLFYHRRFAEDPPVRWMSALMADLFAEPPTPRKGGRSTAGAGRGAKGAPT
jgi:DNA-binding transcriptional LysR family regulator